MKKFHTIFYRISLVKQIPIFSKLNIFELRRIAKRCAIQDFKKGEIICKQGTPPDSFYCLISGRIQAYTANEHGKKSDVEFIRRGMHFGIISLLTGENHPQTCEALNDSIVLKIEKEDFETIFQSIPQLGVGLSQSLSKRIHTKETGRKSAFESSIVSVYSPIRGSGSSTYAVNLALHLERETKRKVLLLNISSVFRMALSLPSEVDEATPQWKKEALDLLDITDNHEKILQSISSGEIGIDLLNVKINTEDAQLVSQISHFVSTLATDYHYVIVDLPTEMDDVVLNTLIQSDMIHLLAIDHGEYLQVTRQIINQLEENLNENFNIEKIKVIISGRQAKCYLSYEEVNKVIDFDVYTKLPHISRSELNVAVISEYMSVITPRNDSEYYKAVRIIARQMSGVMVGLVLGGGAALGVAHIGVIRVLEKENIPIDIVVGSSMGALIAAFWSIGQDSKELEKLAREFETRYAILKLCDPVIPISGFLGGRLIRRWLKSRGLKNKTFYSTRIPLKIVSYDLIKREEIILDSGSLVDAVRCSASIPGVIEPVLDKDKVIIDGGVLNPLPTNVLMNLGIRKIIAINVLQSPEHVTKGFLQEQAQLKGESRIPFYKNPWHYITFRIGRCVTKLLTPNISDIIVRSLQASEYVIAQQSAKNADIVIHPDLEGINWFELNKVDDLIRRGEEATRKALPQIKQLIDEN